MIFFAPVIAKYIEKNLDITKPRYSKHILRVPQPSAISRFFCTEVLDVKAVQTIKWL